MADFEEQYPTQGDLAREQLRRRGIRYFGDVLDEVKSRLQKIPSESRMAFAVACAERTMRYHEGVPKSSQRPFTLSWRPALNAIWIGLKNDRKEADRVVRESLDRFQASPYDHNDGQDGPDDADEPSASTAISAAECFLNGDVDSAFWSASSAIDLAFNIADEELQLDPNDFIWDPDAEPIPLAKEAMHSSVQEELKRQLVDLALLEDFGDSPDVIEKLKARQRSVGESNNAL